MIFENIGKKKEEKKMAILTNHGKKRIKERAGIPKKAAQASIERALSEGLDRKDLSGSLRRYVDWIYHQNEFDGKTIKIYGNMIYIFDRMVLITTFVLPTKYIKTAEMIKEKKKRDDRK